jgi:hypothetical protein
MLGLTNNFTRLHGGYPWWWYMLTRLHELSWFFPGAGRCISPLCMLVFHAHGNPLRGCTYCIPVEPIWFVSIVQQVAYESKRVTTMWRFEYTSCIWFPAADGFCKEMWLFLVLLQWPFSVLCSPCFHGFLVETSTRLWSCQRHRTPDAPILSVEEQPYFHHVFYEVFDLSGGRDYEPETLIYIYIHII